MPRPVGWGMFRVTYCRADTVRTCFKLSHDTQMGSQNEFISIKDSKRRRVMSFSPLIVRVSFAQVTQLETVSVIGLKSLVEVD